MRRFIREWTDPENSLHPGLEERARRLEGSGSDPSERHAEREVHRRSADSIVTLAKQKRRPSDP